MVLGQNYGGIYISTDSGQTFTHKDTTPMDVTSNFEMVVSADGSKMVGINYNQHVWTSVDAGTTWVEQIGTASTTYTEICASSDATKVLIAAEADALYTSVNSGVNFTKHSSGLNKQWRGVGCSSDFTKLIAVENNNGASGGGYVYISTDSGSTWVQGNNFTNSSGSVPARAKGNWAAVAASSDFTFLVLADYSKNVWTSNNSGVDWFQMTSLNTYPNKLAISDDGQTIISAPDNYLQISYDGANSWSIVNGTGLPGSKQWYAMCASSNATKILLGANNEYFWTYYS